MRVAEQLKIEDKNLIRGRGSKEFAEMKSTSDEGQDLLCKQMKDRMHSKKFL